MHNKQKISLPDRIYDNYYQEIKYLTSNSILNKTKGNIQFFHQSFFDFVFAKNFVERGKLISKVLRKQHQGLFVRSSVRQVLAYLRDVEPQSYIKELRTLLLSPNKKYRYHLKLMIINQLGFEDEPLPSEKEFVEKYILKYHKNIITKLRLWKKP